MEKQEAPVGLQKKKLAIMATLGQMHKDSTNKEQKFKYLSDDAMIAAVQAALLEQKIVLTPPEVVDVVTSQYTTGRGTTMNLAVVKVRLGLIDTETGDTETGICVGTGADMSDKAAYKALTGARKYFFRLLFAVGTGDDPDKETPGAEQGDQSGQARPPRPAPAPTRHENRRDPLDDMIDRAFVDMGVPVPDRMGTFRSLADKYGGNKEKVANVLADMAAAGEKWGSAALFGTAPEGYQEG